MRKSLLATFIVTLLTTAYVSAQDEFGLLSVKAESPAVSITVGYPPKVDYRNNLDNMLRIRVDSNTYPKLNCVQAYLDFRYTLTGEHGNVVPVDAGVLKNPPPDHTTLDPRDGTLLCDSPISHKTLIVLLRFLYPNLKPGNYRLAIEFSPRNAEMVGVRLRVKPIDISFAP